MNFSEVIKEEARHTYTENGAKALNSTSNACLDLFGVIGSLRMRSEDDTARLFAEAYKEDPLLATKILFYARDIREGCGERKVFRDLIRYCAINHPEAIRSNIDLIGFYGRYDDLYSLVDTPLEKEMWSIMGNQLRKDITSMRTGQSCSLLAKWIKTPDASSPNTRKLGIKTALSLGYSVRDFKRILRQLRKYIDVVECHMSANEWNLIQYPSVPSKAMTLYRNAFTKHDEERFKEFISRALTGEEKINSRHDVFHADADRKGVQLCSGSSAVTFKYIIDSVGLTPIEMMLKIINSERYSDITIE